MNPSRLYMREATDCVDPLNPSSIEFSIRPTIKGSIKVPRNIMTQTKARDIWVDFTKGIGRTITNYSQM